MIGGKIQSGRTKDENIGHVAEYLKALGIDPEGVRAEQVSFPKIISAHSDDAIRTRLVW